MNEIIETSNDGGSADLLTQLRSAVGTWPPSAGLLEKHKVEKANLKFQSDKFYWERRDRKMAGLKERARQVIQRNRDGLI